MDEKKLLELQAELKTYFDKAAEEKKTFGTLLDTTKAAIEALQKQVDAIDAKLADKHSGDPKEPTLEEELKQNESVARVMRDKSGRAVIVISAKNARRIMEQKTTITSAAVGYATTGVLQIDRIPGITLEARQVLKVRDLLTARPTTLPLVDFVKVSSPMAIGSPQIEASDKAQNAVTFTAASERVRTIATWIPASRQVLDDFTELAGFLNSTLPYYVNLEEELQLLSGDGTGENLHGLITQASGFNTGLLSATAGWNKIDIVGRTIQQIEMAKELQPTFVVVNPKDYWDMRLQKDQYGRYILGDPQGPVNTAALFGLQPVRTTSISSGTFLVGSGDPAAAEIRDRMEMQLEISTEHSDYFTKNLVAVRAEKRLALVVKRAASYITGTFTTSP